jgi:hypothetical protein
MTRPRWALAAVGAICLLALGTVSILNTRAPSVPDESALPLLARTVLTGEMTPDVTEGVHPSTLSATPSGQECLSIDRPAGPWSICWAANRDPNDADPAQDYYRFRVYGTFGGETGTGVRWASVLVKLVGEPSNNVFLTTPRGVYEGPCEQVPTSVGPGPIEPETICGRTVGGAGRAPWSQLVTWTCMSCLIPDHQDRALSLHQWVAVPQATIPTWEIFADLGS